MTSKVEKIPADIQPGRMDVVRVAQLTDSHIFAESDGCLLGLNTRESFEAVCARIRREEWRPDLLLATGDLSQDASESSYQYLADYFAEMDYPTFWLPGNHDNPQTMEKVLSNQKVMTAKHILCGHWQIIMLDSSVPGKVYGELAPNQLAFIHRILQRHPDKHTLLVLHHQPLAVGSKWLDEIGLRNADELKQLVAENNQVKGVLWGHVHQDFHKIVNGVSWIATPSCCVQFKPGSKDFAAGPEAPGYRYLNLYCDGRIESVVHRIDNLEYTVDYSIKGY